MQEEKNGQTPQDEPSPATSDIVEKGADAEGQEPSSATQDVMHFAEDPPKAKQDVIMEAVTTAHLKGSNKESGGGEEEDGDKA